MKNWLTLFKEDPLLAIRTLPYPVWLILMVGGILSVALSNQTKSPESPLVPPSLKGIDTFIPKNFSLIPLQELQNQESLDSLLGAYGMVDLYSSPSEQPSEKTLLAKNVKILRAPKNPSQLAVLVPTPDAPHILGAKGPLTALLIHPELNGTEFESIKSPSRFEQKKSEISHRARPNTGRPTFNFNMDED